MKIYNAIIISVSMIISTNVYASTGMFGATRYKVQDDNVSFKYSFDDSSTYDIDIAGHIFCTQNCSDCKPISDQDASDMSGSVLKAHPQFFQSLIHFPGDDRLSTSVCSKGDAPSITTDFNFIKITNKSSNVSTCFTAKGINSQLNTGTTVNPSASCI